jgi:hypothetical protein
MFLVRKLILSTPRLLRSLHTLSLAKAVPDCLKDSKCKKIALHKHPLIPYVPEKLTERDCVQEMFSAFKENHLKTQLEKGMELLVLIWHSSMCEAFLIHVGSAQEAIERKGYFKAYMESNEVYMEKYGRIKQAKAQLAKLDDSTNGEAGTSRKFNKKSNVATAKASPADKAMQADLMTEIKQAQEAADKAKAKGDQAATDMF